MIHAKNKKYTLFFIAFLFGAMISLGIDHSTVSAQRTYQCVDGPVEVPAQAMGGMTPEDACINSGGPVEVGARYRCANGDLVEVPVNAPGGVTAEQACINSGGPAQQSSGERNEIEADCTIDSTAANCGITRYLVLFINVLSVLAGIVIAASIAWGGIEYSMSGSDPQKVSAAKDRIRNAIIALVFFIFGYAILNYLVPGGVL